MNRRDFLRSTALAGAALQTTAGGAKAEPPSRDDLPRQGPKAVVRGKRAVASSQHPIVTQTMLEVLKSGGNAVDAVTAGCITQAAVQMDMTNHTGTVCFLYWEAKTGKIHQLNSSGTLVAVDIVKRLRPATTDNAQVWIARVSSVGVMILAILWSTQGGKYSSIFEAINAIGADLAPPITTVFIWGVFWRRGTRQASLVTLISGFLLGATAFALDLPAFER